VCRATIHPPLPYCSGGCEKLLRFPPRTILEWRPNGLPFFSTTDKVAKGGRESVGLIIFYEHALERTVLMEQILPTLKSGNAESQAKERSYPGNPGKASSG
jgi:hypothetical protein